MRKITLILLALMGMFTQMQAQSAQTIHVSTPGTLEVLLGADKNTTTDLRLTGTVNDADFTTIKQMTVLKNLDMGALNIANGKIPNSAFQGKVMNSITLPSSLKGIGDFAFASMTIPALDFSICLNLESMGQRVFDNMKLTNNVIDLSRQDRVQFIYTPGNGVFYGTFSGCLSHVILPRNMTALPDYSFAHFKGTIDLPEGLASLGLGALSYVVMDQELILPSGLTSIRNGAFAGSNLKSIQLPSSLRHIEDGAFSGATISALDFSTCLNLESMGQRVFNNMKLTNNVIDLSRQDRVQFIYTPGNGVFYGTFSGCLSHVILPRNMTALPDYSFAHFRGTIDLPEGLASLGLGALSYVVMDQELILPSGLTSIRNGAFAGSNLKSIQLPSSLRHIEDGAFNGATISALDFSTCLNLESMGSRVFANIKLTNNVIDLSRQDRVQFIYTPGNGVFYGTFSGCLSHVILPRNMTALPDYSFAHFRGTIDLPEGLASLGLGALSYVVMDQELILPSGLTSIGNGAFAGSNLKSIKLSSSLKEIGDFAFNGITIPALDFSPCLDLELIGLRVFENIKLTNNVVDLSRQEHLQFKYTSVSGIFNGTFSGCLSHVILPHNMTAMPDCLFTRFKGTLDFPAGLVSIGASVFADAVLNQDIVLPSGLTTIGGTAFTRASIQSIQFPSSLMRIEDHAFSSATVPALDFSHCSDIRYIGLNAFDKTKLTNMTLDFAKCSELELAGKTWSWTVIGSFTGSSAHVILPRTMIRIPDMSFSSFLGTVDLPPVLETVGGRGFFESKMAEPMVLPPTVKVLEGAAFASSVLKGITLSSSLTTIGDGVFQNTTVPNLDFSNCYLQFIGNEAFKNVKLENDVIDLSIHDELQLSGKTWSWTVIGTFSGCSSHVILPRRMTLISDMSFSSFLGSVDLPPVLETISGRAFFECNMSAGITLPKSLKILKQGAFERATIPSITFEKMGDLPDVICY